MIVGANSPLSLNIIESLPAENTLVLYHSKPKYKREGVKYFSSTELSKIPKVDVVFIISAFIPEPGRNLNSEKELFDVNVEFIKTITTHFKFSRLVFASSVSIYNADSGSIICENSEISPATPYAISKLWGESIVKEAKSYAILRISSLIGKGAKEQTFVPIVIKNAIQNKTITLFGQGERKQNYINYYDAAQMFIRASELSGNGIYLAVGTKSFSNREVAEIIKNILPGTIINYQNEDTSPSYNYNAAKTYEALNYTPLRSLTDSITEIITWKKEQF